MQIVCNIHREQVTAPCPLAVDGRACCWWPLNLDSRIRLVNEVKMEMEIAQGLRTRLRATHPEEQHSLGGGGGQCLYGLGKVLTPFMNELGRTAQLSGN